MKTQIASLNPSQAQHQSLDAEASSQELRFTSLAGQRVRWITGVYGIDTDRFISTGNMFDPGNFSLRLRAYR